MNFRESSQFFVLSLLVILLILMGACTLPDFGLNDDDDSLAAGLALGIPNLDDANYYQVTGTVTNSSGSAVTGTEILLMDALDYINSGGSVSISTAQTQVYDPKLVSFFVDDSGNFSGVLKGGLYGGLTVDLSNGNSVTFYITVSDGIATVASVSGGYSVTVNSVSSMGLNKSCALAPGKIIYGSSIYAGTDTTFTCSANHAALTITCTDSSANTITFLYPSVAAAQVSLFDGPAAASYAQVMGFRGEKISHNFAGGNTDIDPTLDSSYRQTGHTYDSSGYPLTFTGPYALQYTYSGSDPLPTLMEIDGDADTVYEDSITYSKGYATVFDFGSVVTAATYIGNIHLCE